MNCAKLTRWPLRAQMFTLTTFSRLRQERHGDAHGGRRPGGAGKIERTIPVRFSLDETFDIGEDTGTPVVEDYINKMPFGFTGTLNKVVVVLDQ